MRVNVYAEEMTDRVELVEKATQDGKFIGLRFYLYLPVTSPCSLSQAGPRLIPESREHRGPFLHREGDDDSAAVTFWGKRQLRTALVKALALLDEHDKARETERVQE